MVVARPCNRLWGMLWLVQCMRRPRRRQKNIDFDTVAKYLNGGRKLSLHTWPRKATPDKTANAALVRIVVGPRIPATQPAPTHLPAEPS